MSHAFPEDPRDAVPRAESLAKITAMAARLRSHGVSPPEPFVWARREEARWWAFGRFGRYTVETPRRLGWPVGDYPWEGAVHDRTGISNEVFVKPTFVDAEGRIAPLSATRASPLDNHLLTGEMCQDIADRMERFAAQFAPATRPAPHATDESAPSAEAIPHPRSEPAPEPAAVRTAEPAADRDIDQRRY